MGVFVDIAVEVSVGELESFDAGVHAVTLIKEGT